MNCERCQTVTMFPDEGIWIGYPASDMIQLGFLEALAEYGNQIEVGDRGQVKLNYKSGDLLKIAEQLKKGLEPMALKASRIGCFSSMEAWHGFGMMTAFEFVERVEHRDFLSLIQRKAFRHMIQPIVSFETGSAYGYEFLMRPLEGEASFSPGDLFAFSQRAGLQSALDSASRIRSIEASARMVPKGINRFINFLPSSIYDPRHCLKSTMQVADDNQVDANDLIFEVVETERIDDLGHLKRILQFYKDQGMRVALDDIGTGYSTTELLKDLRPDFAKLDRTLIQDCDQFPEKRESLNRVIDQAKALNITVIAEGIERREEYQICQELGADLAQGYYIGKPSFSLWEPAVSLNR